MPGEKKPRQRKRPEVAVMLEAPENAVRWAIGGKEYLQWALSVRQTSRLITVLVAEVRTVAGTPAFSELMRVDFAETPAEELVPTLIALTSVVPALIPRVLCVILRADPDDEDFIADHATPVQALKILEMFVEQNEPQALVQSFFALSRQIRAMMPATVTAEPEG